MYYKEKTDLDSNRHLYLFAKRWYVFDSENIVEETKKAVNKIYFGSDKLPSSKDVANILINLVSKQKNNFFQNKISYFIEELDPTNWKWNYLNNSVEYSYWDRIIIILLSNMRLTKLSDIPFSLGVPDPDFMSVYKPIKSEEETI